MFTGLMSRCRIPAAWAVARPSATPTRSSTIWRQVRRLVVLQSASVPPSMNSVHSQDVRVVEGGCGGRLLLKPSANRCVGERVAKDLDRNRAIQSRITCPIHLAHAARSEQAVDLVGTQAGATVQGHGREIISVGLAAVRLKPDTTSASVTPPPVVTPPV